MELSTSIPSTTTIPAMEICCRPKPDRSTNPIPMIRDKGNGHGNHDGGTETQGKKDHQAYQDHSLQKVVQKSADPLF